MWVAGITMGTTTEGIGAGETGHPTFRLRNRQCIGPQLLGRSSQKATDFTATIVS